jgi:phosphatidylglycerophosphatase C
MSTSTPPQQPLLVVFDLDGTITRRDTLFGYVLGFGFRNGLRILGLPQVLPELWRFLRGRSDHGLLKAALIRSVMANATRQDVAAWTQRYLPQLLRQGVFFNALKQIEQHRAAGDHLVLMTATVDLYVPELAATLGFDEWICSRVAWVDNRLQGDLIGANVRDEEKARQLRELRQRFPGRQVVAYGNSLPDLPHMRLADRGVLINANAALRRAAADMTIDFRNWT